MKTGKAFLAGLVGRPVNLEMMLGRSSTVRPPGATIAMPRPDLGRVQSLG